MCNVKFNYSFSVLFLRILLPFGRWVINCEGVFYQKCNFSGFLSKNQHLESHLKLIELSFSHNFPFLSIPTPHFNIIYVPFKIPTSLNIKVISKKQTSVKITLFPLNVCSLTVKIL